MLAALSLLLFAAVCVLWVRRYWVEDVLSLSAYNHVHSCRGRATLLRFCEQDLDPTALRLISLPPEHNAGFWREVWAATADPVHTAGFGYGRLYYPGSGGFHGVCPSCGYDLRATPDRCPECGATATATGYNRHREGNKAETL